MVYHLFACKIDMLRCQMHIYVSASETNNEVHLNDVCTPSLAHKHNKFEWKMNLFDGKIQCLSKHYEFKLLEYNISNQPRHIYSTHIWTSVKKTKGWTSNIDMASPDVWHCNFMSRQISNIESSHRILKVFYPVVNNKFQCSAQTILRLI